MSGPWEKYQAAAPDEAPAGPWAKYQTQPAAAGAQAPASAPVDDIPRMLPRQRATALANLPQGAMQPGDLLAGLVRGSGSIGATLLTPYDLLAGNTQSIGNPERRAAMDQALVQLGADPESFAYKAGKVGGELAGTAGVGPALAPAARAVGASPALVSAINTAGMRTGAAPAGFAAKAADLGTRAAGGAINGGASAALADPSQAAGGAAVGAALPPVVKAAGAVATATGKTLRLSGAELTNMLKSEPTRAAQDLIRALDLTPEQIPAVVAKLRGAETLVDGAAPTVGQALSMPQASILERVVAAGAGGEKLRQALQAQAEARMAALHGVAPVDPNGYQQARADTGEAIGRYAKAERGQAATANAAQYQAVDPAGAARITMPADEMQAAAAQFVGPGAVGKNQMPAQFSREASALSAPESGQPMYYVPAPAPRQVRPQQAAPRPMPQSQPQPQPQPRAKPQPVPQHKPQPQQLGEPTIVYDAFGTPRMAPPARAFVQAPAPPSAVVYDAFGTPRTPVQERAFIPPPAPPSTVRYDQFGTPAPVVEPQYFTPGKQAPVPGGGGGGVAYNEFGVPVQAAPRASEWQEVMRMRSSLNEQIQAAINNGDNQAAAAMTAQIKALDKAIETQAPADVLGRWQEANASRHAIGQRFDTGPQAAIFSTRNGEPLVQGGEVAAKFWGNRPGLAEDVQSFRRLIDDNPAMLGQFRSMITTEGADKAAQGGVLGAKFVDWVRNMKPGLRAAFEPAQLASLERIAADVERAGAAAKLGMGPGSNTYQNAATALDAGLLGSPFAKSMAQRIPFVGSVAEGLRAAGAKSASEAKAMRLSDLLSNAGGAADELQRQVPSAAAAKFRHLMDMGGVTLGTPIPQLGGLTLSEFLRLGGYKAAPVAAAQ